MLFITLLNLCIEKKINTKKINKVLLNPVTLGFGAPKIVPVGLNADDQYKDELPISIAWYKILKDK